MNRLTSAEKILQSLGITEPDEIDLEAIAWTQNVKIKCRHLEGCEAQIIGDEDVAIISVDIDVSDNRKRFSIAHELGHWNHDRGKSFYCKSDAIGFNIANNKIAEQNANKFAANLILPPYIFFPILKNYSNISFDAIKDAANKFKTSLTATAIQVIESNLFPAILVLCQKNKRKWFKRARQIPGRWFPDEYLDRGTEAYKIFKGNFRESSSTLPAITWFDNQENDEYEVTEYSFRITENEILSLIVFDDDRMLEDK